MNILGLSDVTGNHSHSCVALLENGSLAMALSQERLSRVKNDCAFLQTAIDTVLAEQGLRLDDIDLFACGYPAPRYYASLFNRNWLDLPAALFGVAIRRPDRLLKYLAPNVKKALYDPSHSAAKSNLAKNKLIFIDHHLAHVTAAYAASGLEECLAISYGGFAPHADGRNVAGAVYLCRGDQIRFLEDIPFYATGCWYSGITVALGFRYMQQEGKTMGLAGLGNPQTCYESVQSIATRFAADRWQPYRYWLDYLFTPRAEVFLSSRSGRRLSHLVQEHGAEDVAAAAQRIWQENLQNFITYLIAKYRLNQFVLAGGLFLNVSINRMIAEQTDAATVFVFPHPGDGSTPIGAALLAHYSQTGTLPRIPITDTAWGCCFTPTDILQEFSGLAHLLQVKDVTDPAGYAAQQIRLGRIIGWFQGREEYGPRSSGRRCILAAAVNEKFKLEINRRKGREPWIPLGVSCLLEKGADFFDHWQPSPFMTRTFQVKEAQQAVIPAAVHADGSCRVQSVAKEPDRLFRKMLECIYDLTGIGLLLNSSLNRHGEPLVHRPAEAMALLLDGVIDELVIENLVITPKS